MSTTNAPGEPPYLIAAGIPITFPCWLHSHYRNQSIEKGWWWRCNTRAQFVVDQDADEQAGAPTTHWHPDGPMPTRPPSGPAEETKGDENKCVEPFSIREGIRVGMERKGWSQSDLASHLNVSRQYVSRILDDAIPEPNWTLGHLREISTALDLNLTVFLSTKS